MYNYSSAEMESVPCLAAAMGMWDPTMQNLTITLKPGVTFHDGSKFNASAVKWNFERLQYWTYGIDYDADGDLDVNPAGTASISLFKQGDTPILNRTEILNEYQVKFVLNLPSIIWEKLLAFIGCSIILPDTNYDYGEKFFNRIDLNDELIGTGPFMLTDYEFDNQVVFDYYPNYHLQWEENHIERMIYLIIPDPITSSLAVLWHEVHWGGVTADYQDEFDADPDLLTVRVKGTLVYFILMNLYNMPYDIRYASSFAWNHSYWLNVTSDGQRYELHVPIPDGMQYHYKGFVGDPEYDLEKARDILLNSADPEIAANITANNLSETNTTAEWRTVAESETPVAWFNFTRYYLITPYTSTTVQHAAEQLQDNLKDIGIRLEILKWMSWSDWTEDFLEDPASHTRLSYTLGTWRPYYNDPINMIEPLYGTNASNNCFGLDNATWNNKLIATYSLTADDRRDMFYEIQVDFVTIHIPAFYIFQTGEKMSFNRAFVDEDSIGDLYNKFGLLYWFNVRFTPPWDIGPLIPWNELIARILLFIVLGLVGAVIITATIDIIYGWKSIINRSMCKCCSIKQYYPNFAHIGV